MKRLAISTETAADLNEELIRERQIECVPYGIVLGEKTYYDGEFSTQQIFDYVKQYKVLPKTNAVNQYSFEEHFSKLSKEYETIVHFTLSSGVTSAYQNACKAAEKFDNVYVVDSKQISAGIALLVLRACDMRDEGAGAKEIIDEVCERTKYIQSSCVIDTLDYVHKGGRCSSILLLGANLFKIHPEILILNGKMEMYGKFRGNMRMTVENYCKKTLEEFNEPDLNRVFITHCRASDEEVEAAQNALKTYGFKNIYTVIAGSTVTSHTGPNSLGIQYLNGFKVTKREKQPLKEKLFPEKPLVKKKKSAE